VSDLTIAAVVATIFYMLAGFRVYLVMCRQTGRARETPDKNELAIASLWPLAFILVGISILFLDVETPGFEKISSLPSEERS